MKKTIATLSLIAMPYIAQADCSVLRSAAITTPDVTIVDQIQLGLRTALDDNNILLSDSKLGVYTRVGLVRLCQTIPLPDATDLVQSTLGLARDYGALATLVPNWHGIASDDAFAAAILPQDSEPYNLNVMALAGSPAGVAQWMLDETAASDCGTLSDAALAAPARAGLMTLSTLDPTTWPSARSVCTALDQSGGAQTATDALTSLGRLEASLPGAVNQILAPDFALWLAEDIATRGPRLVGSDDALIALVAQYRAENRAATPQDFSALYITPPASCHQSTGTRITDYVSFDQSALDGLVAPVDVAGLLAGLAAQSFDSARDLTAAIDAALAGQVSACTRDQVMLAVQSPDHFGQAFQLNADKTANLALIPEFAPSAHVVAPYVGLTAQSRAALLTGLRANLQSATTARVKADVEAAADVLANAAEPLSDTFDTLPEGVPAFEPISINPTIGVTDATDSAVAATVSDVPFRDALLAANYAPAPNAEVLKSDARKILAPIAEDRIATSVNRDMLQLLGAVETTWSLTDTLSQAIAAAPAARAIHEVTTDPAAAGELKQLLGVEYPNSRLFDAALAQLNPAPSATTLADIRTNVSRTAPDLTTRYDTKIAQPDCGCVDRRTDYAEIYSFYPFWFAPEQSDAEPVPGRMVDFSLVSRAAFYGLEFVLADGQTLELQNEIQWVHGQRDFVNAAHRHRAQADLAIKLTGWADWSDVQIATAVQKIVTLTDRYPHTDSSDATAWRAAFPYLLDRPQVDGVTLIIDDYDGTAASVPHIERLISLVTLLHADLADRGQTINLAFDLALSQTPTTQPIFSDIRSLLTGDSPFVDYILIFLERPTSNSKKTLRARMENGAFRGIDRAQVLRRIIPVIPPSGNAHVLQSAASGAATDAPVPGSFSQLTDDLVYFHDNFGGVGFWPAPDPLNSEAPVITAKIAQMWFKPTLPEFFTTFEDNVDRACTAICPNRSYVAAVAALIFLATVLLVWRSFYSGFVDKLAFKLGLAWLGGAAFFAAILALTVCDAVAIWPPVLLFMCIVGVGVIIAFQTYQGARNGPKP